MWRLTRNRTLICSILTLVLLMAIPEFINALRNVSVTIPLAVKRGDNAMLICNYDIENETLYTVKWYRGRREFYRYTPKENPAWKIFHQAATNGITVETTQSNASHIFLRNIPLSVSGKYACEVSADQPTFHTSIASAEMDVVELPTQRPIITGIHSRYRLGDIVNGNCSSDYSKPAANLTWWINDIQAHPHYLHRHEIQKHINENLESIVLEINFVVTLHHFIKGRLKLKCSARIHNIYAQETEKILEEDRPRILASGRSPDMNMYPFDHPTDGEGHFDEEMYLTHFKETSAAAATIHSNKIISTQLNNLIAALLILPTVYLNCPTLLPTLSLLAKTIGMSILNQISNENNDDSTKVCNEYQHEKVITNQSSSISSSSNANGNLSTTNWR